MINSDTTICGSFSEKAGNNGCKVFNSAFKYYDMNWMYKSFSINDISKAVESMRTLSFRGAAVSMPYKISVMEHIDEIDDLAKRIGSVNTLINDDGFITGYNTDYFGSLEIVKSLSNNPIFVLGNGGMAKATFAAIEDCGKEYEIITRKNWNSLEKIKDSQIINCTPIDYNVDKSNVCYDFRVFKEAGWLLYKKQASIQFKLYCDKEMPTEAFGDNS